MPLHWSNYYFHGSIWSQWFDQSTLKRKIRCSRQYQAKERQGCLYPLRFRRRPLSTPPTSKPTALQAAPVPSAYQFQANQGDSSTSCNNLVAEAGESRLQVPCASALGVIVSFTDASSLMHLLPRSAHLKDVRFSWRIVANSCHAVISLCKLPMRLWICWDQQRNGLGMALVGRPAHSL